VEGEMLPNHASQVTQDFIFNNASTFHSAIAKDFLKSITLLDRHADDSEALKQVVSSVAQTAEEGLELAGEKSAFLKGFGILPPILLERHTIRRRVCASGTTSENYI
jgi:hypothetical protein